MKNKCNREDALIYLILIPFLYPEGFAEYSVIYGTIFKTWLCFTVFLVVLDFLYTIINKVRYNAFINFTMIFHAYMLVDTLALQGGVSEGLQKIFAAPALCYITVRFMKGRAEIFLRCVSNILIVIFALNLTIFSSYVMPSFFPAAGKIRFLGHVQIAAQLGAIGILIGCFLISISGRYKRKGVLLCLLSTIVVLQSRTLTGYVCLAIWLLGLIVVKIIKKPLLIELNPIIYSVVLLTANLLMLVYLNNNSWIFYTSFHGRISIWLEAAEKISTNKMFGYGVYGYELHPYWYAWSDTASYIKYAHNELLQLMLDGGIVLVILFFIVLFACLNRAGRVKNKFMRAATNLCLISFLLTMIPDVPTEYHHTFMFFSVLSELDKVDLAVKRHYLMENRACAAGPTH